MCSTQTDHLFGKQKREAEASRTLNFHKSTLDKKSYHRVYIHCSA